MTGDAVAFAKYDVKTRMTPDHTAFQVRCRVEPDLVGLPGKVLTLDTMRILRCIVDAACWP